MKCKLVELWYCGEIAGLMYVDIHSTSCRYEGHEFGKTKIVWYMATVQ